MASSGVPGVPAPTGEDYLAQRVKALERRVDELGPSLMAATADAIGTAVTFVTGTGNGGAFAVPITPISSATPLVTCVIDVPAGYSYVGIIAVGLVAAKNTTGGALPLWATIKIGADAGDISEITVGAGATLPITTTSAVEFAPTGSTITLRLKAASSSGWASDAANTAVLSALATFRRNA